MVGGEATMKIEAAQGQGATQAKAADKPTAPATHF
jgi:hypothetical protein